jgi:lysozyme family protein
MANFDEALAFVLRNEDPHLTGIVTEDSGGRTRFGIAERFHPNLGHAFYTGPADTALQTAREIYRYDYWKPICGVDIADQRVAAKLLDMAVNMGVRQAVVLCQRALNACATFQLDEDGVLGEQTLAAINECDPALLLIYLRQNCEDFYQRLAAKRPATQRYLRGWLARARA